MASFKVIIVETTYKSITVEADDEKVAGYLALYAEPHEFELVPETRSPSSRRHVVIARRLS